jgi:uncharacterized protein YeaO (DUF488 family)
VAGVSTFRIGDEPRRGEVLRIGTTRYPPRGVPRNRWKKDHYFDVKKTGIDDPKVRKRFFDAYRRELKRPPACHGLSLLAALAQTTAIAVGCYCSDETRCHRCVLREEIERAIRRQT